MVPRDLSASTPYELVRHFGEEALAHGKATNDGDHRAANKAAERVHELFLRLTQIGMEGRQALLDLAVSSPKAQDLVVVQWVRGHAYGPTATTDVPDYILDIGFDQGSDPRYPFRSAVYPGDTSRGPGYLEFYDSPGWMPSQSCTVDGDLVEYCGDWVVPHPGFYDVQFEFIVNIYSKRDFLFAGPRAFQLRSPTSPAPLLSRQWSATWTGRYPRE